MSNRTTAKSVAVEAPGPFAKATFDLKMSHKPHRPDPDIIPARRFKRLLGSVIDGLLLPLFLLLLPFGGLGLFMGFFYMSFKGNVVGAGRSLGRASMGQRLLARDGTDASHGLVMARNAVRFILWMTILPFWIDLALLLFGDGRLLADRIFGTRVFEDPEKVRAERLTEAEAIADHVAQEQLQWDERHDQRELEAIAHVLGDEDAELAAFEARVTGERDVFGVDPVLGALGAQASVAAAVGIDEPAVEAQRRELDEALEISAEARVEVPALAHEEVR